MQDGFEADAILNAEMFAAIAGARALIVDPADEGVERFYLKYGFRKLPGTDRMAIKLRIAS